MDMESLMMVMDVHCISHRANDYYYMIYLIRTSAGNASLIVALLLVSSR